MTTQSNNLVTKALLIIRTRPTQFFSNLRCYLLFQINFLLRWLFLPKSSGVRLGENVRVQSFRSLCAERPHARISIGADSIVYENAKLESYGKGNIQIGECSILGDIRICSRKRVCLGKRVLSSWNVFIQDYDPHPIDPMERAQQVLSMVAQFQPRRFSSLRSKEVSRYQGELPSQEIHIGDDVWLGAGCTILKGARIGNGCIVAAGAVVARGEYPAGTLIAGNPARAIRSLVDSSESYNQAVGGAS